MYFNPNNQFGDDFRRPGWGSPDYFESSQFGPPNFGTPVGQMPMGSPPGFSPPIPAWRVGSSGIRSCLFTFTFIWLNNGRSFWFFQRPLGENLLQGSAGVEDMGGNSVLL